MRRGLSWLACLTAGLFAVAGAILAAGAGPGPGFFPPTRECEVVYAGSIGSLPEGARELRMWIPLATDREGQKVLERDIKIPVPFEIHRDPVYGNEMASIRLAESLPEKIDFEVRYRVLLSRKHFLETREKSDPSLYLRPSRLAVVNEEVMARAQKAVRNAHGMRERARHIYEYVIGSMSYDRETPGWGQGDTIRACRLGKGNCTDFHSLFTSLSQAVAIPARFKIGLTLPDGPEGAIPGYHCWAEFYEPTKGWQPVDASEAWKHPEKREGFFGQFDPNKFTISMGRDIELVPRQHGEPVNIFFYPYVEVDGRVFPGVATSFSFRDRAQADTAGEAS